MSDSYNSTSISDGVSLSSRVLEFCGKVRNNDLSILPRDGEPFKIHRLSDKEGMELADALLENTIRKALQRQWLSTCVPASACDTFASLDL
jgi:hypothetical protein